jgi:1-acyl-sn-glycerol-3-phosphate acyltransferase
MKVLRGLYFWTMTTVITLVLFALLTVLHAWESIRGKEKDGRSVHGVASLWGKTIIRLMPGWSCEIEGKENLPQDHQPMVIIANHESMSDIWGIYYLGIQFRWLSKDSVFRIPVIGRAMRWANYVAVDRSNRQSGADALAASAQRLQQGVSMFFFPEGTRSLDGTIKAFKIGAFRLACTERVPVLPVAIHGAGAMLPKHSWVPGRAKIQIKVLPALPAPTENDDIELYAERARQLIIAAHKVLVN